MTDLQEHLMQLLTEIDDACSDTGITYALYGGSAGQAHEKGRFVGGCYEMHIMMQACDIAKLKGVLRALGRDDRAFEDMSSNPKLAYNHIRYVDTGTTLIDKADHVRYECLAAAVTIHPLFARLPSRLDKAALRGVVYTNGGVEYTAYELTPKKKRAIAWNRRLQRAFGDGVLASRLYRLVERSEPCDKTGTCYFETDAGNLCAMPSGYVFQTKRVAFAGREVSAPRDMEEYLAFYSKKQTGPDAQSMKTANRIAVICDAATSYEETLRYMAQAGHDVRKLQQAYYEYHVWSCDTLQYWKSLVTADYAYAKLSRDRIDTYMRLRPQLRELRAAYAAGDTQALSELLGDYDAMTRRYRKKGMGFYINDELFAMASRVWEHKGNRDRARQVLALVPDVHKNEDLEEHLAKYVDLPAL